MITVFFRTGLYISSFFPLYILLLIDNYKLINSLSAWKSLFKFETTYKSLFIFVLVSLIILSIFSLLTIKKISLNEKKKFQGICKTEDNLLNYVVTYLVPILSIKIEEPTSLLVNLGLFSLLGFIYVNNSLVYLNPLFLFFKYNVFVTDKNEVIISNHNIYELRKFETSMMKVRQLSHNIYISRK